MFYNVGSMTGFNHVLVGVTIAVAVQQPILAPILAFGSHFVLDALPHYWNDTYVPWNKKFIRLLSIDAALCFAVLAFAIWLFPHLWWLLALCAFMATLPDWLWILHFGLNKQHWFFTFHKKIQWAEKPWGLWIEVPFGCLMTLILVLLAKH